MGGDWGNSEIRKPFEARHPIAQWYDALCRYHMEYIDGSGEIKSIPATGIDYCFTGLAYSLYLLKHNVELQQRFINRLKDIKRTKTVQFDFDLAAYKQELKDKEKLHKKIKKVF